MSKIKPLPTLCLINGNIITLDPTNTLAEAIVIKGETILEVGSNDEIKSLCAESTQIIDLKGKSVLPGFTDCHIHLLTIGIMNSPLMLNLKEATSIEEIKDKVRNEVNRKEQGEWIVGGGWDEKLLAEKRFITRLDLDEAAPNNPVCLIRVCQHNIAVNSKALELANISGDTKSPPGGSIDQDPITNEPTGILREMAATVVRKLVSFDDNDLQLALKSVCEMAVSKGITTIHCFPVLDYIQAPQWRTFQSLLMRDELPLRVYHMIDVSSLTSSVDLGFYSGFGHPMLKMGAIKIFLDGALGSHTAALIDPYLDSSDPNNRGLLMYPKVDQFNELVKRSHRAGFQVSIHCIGDQAITIALDAIEAALIEYPREDSRHRIEHASMLSIDLIKRIHTLGVIASVQPPFIASDGDWVINRVGAKRAQHIYPFKSMLAAGINLAAGSDCPTENMNPFLGIQAAVSRQTNAGDSFNFGEKISVEQALRLYTIDAAYASFEEHNKGSIERNKLADLVILSENPLNIPPNNLGDIEVEMTIVGGKIVYSKNTMTNSS